MTDQEQRAIIMIVDDTPANTALLEAAFSTEYRVKIATCGSEALARARETPPDLFLLDIMMPEMDGYEVCRLLKENPHLRDIPVIFLSSLDTTEIKVNAFKSGGVDYITKPFHIDEVRARVSTHLRIRSLQLQLEQTNAERTRLAMIVESSVDAIFTVSTDNIVTSWNGGAEEIFGYSAREIIGSKIFTIMPGTRHKEKSHIWQTILSGEHLQYFETTRSRKDHRQIYISITTSPLLNTDGEIIGNSVISRDVTERRRMEELIKHQAHYDVLTNLPNRQFFMELFSSELAQTRRNNSKLALLFLDLNDFKQVNDTRGHSCGDHLLQAVARRLKTGIRESDTVARLGGDEFTILMPNLTVTDEVYVVLEKIQELFEIPVMVDGVAIDSTTSIGVSIFPDDGECCDELMKKADIAMYAAKVSGKNSYRFYDTVVSTLKGSGTSLSPVTCQI